MQLMPISQYYSGMNLPSNVTIVEVGPRDGLQNEKQAISLEEKLELVHRLSQTGLKVIEAGSFVSPKWVPQMAASETLFQTMTRAPGIRYSALVPNQRGLDTAIACGVEEVALFAAATETFSKTNINCSIAESLQRFADLAKQAIDHGMRVRGYISCVLGCPYEGDVNPEIVTQLSQQLLDMGCYECSLGDTIGVGSAGSTEAMFEHLCANNVAVEKLAFHAHDTYGQALANILVALNFGVATIDASVAGLGGCPYAKGASGNVATEDVLYMLNGLGISHGANLEVVVECGNYISAVLNRPNQSRAANAITQKRSG